MGGSSIPYKELPPCEVGTGTVLLSGGVTIDVSEEGALWVGRASPPKGDLVLKIQGGEETSEGIPVSGFVTGMALDNTSKVGAALIRFRDVFMRFGGATGNGAIVKGVAERTGRRITGTITGDIEFSNAFGDAWKCPAITWSLEPSP